MIYEASFFVERSGNVFVILVYDVGVKRVGKVLKIARKYLIHVQKSVFEGILTQAKLDRLMYEIESIIDVLHDTVVIYTFDSLKYSQKLAIGKQMVDRDII